LRNSARLAPRDVASVQQGEPKSDRNRGRIFLFAIAQMCAILIAADFDLSTNIFVPDLTRARKLSKAGESDRRT